MEDRRPSSPYDRSARLDGVGMTVTRTPFRFRSTTSAALSVPSGAWNRRAGSSRVAVSLVSLFPGRSTTAVQAAPIHDQVHNDSRIENQRRDSHEAAAAQNLETFDGYQGARGQDNQYPSPALSPQNADSFDRMENGISERSCLDPEALRPVEAR